jgi:AcrR family transcriptional regulator
MPSNATRVTPPQQERSAKTLERIVEATEALLRTRSLDEVTVREIVNRAKCPVASFYARFKSKDDLLPHLYERYDARVVPAMEARAASIDLTKIPLRKAVEMCVDLIIDSYSRDKWLMREVALFARRNPGAIGGEMRKNRAGMHSEVARRFVVYKKDIRHKDPVRAMEVGIFIVASVARETILFGAAPHAASTGLSGDALRATLIHTLHSFLTTPCAPPHLCCLPSRR